MLNGGAPLPKITDGYGAQPAISNQTPVLCWETLYKSTTLFIIMVDLLNMNSEWWKNVFKLL